MTKILKMVLVKFFVNNIEIKIWNLEMFECRMVFVFKIE